MHSHTAGANDYWLDRRCDRSDSGSWHARALSCFLTVAVARLTGFAIKRLARPVQPNSGPARAR
jgi:hypothetical protein